LDLTGLQLSLYLEGLGFSAAPVPSYAPLIFRGVEPRGILSLKHAAWLAGLGAFGRSGMVYHPSYGARLRLGAVVTTAELEPARPVNGSPCPEDCRECLESCPSGALSDEGFDKMACLAYAIRHGIYPLAFRDEEGIRNMELVINTAGYDYWIKCCECLRACPLNSQGP
jgi:epoxyqueuosine reductase QueG